MLSSFRLSINRASNLVVGMVRFAGGGGRPGGKPSMTFTDIQFI
jgi:hypothetical protein